MHISIVPACFGSLVKKGGSIFSFSSLSLSLSLSHEFIVNTAAERANFRIQLSFARGEWHSHGFCRSGLQMSSMRQSWQWRLPCGWVSCWTYLHRWECCIQLPGEDRGWLHWRSDRCRSTREDSNMQIQWDISMLGTVGGSLASRLTARSQCGPFGLSACAEAYSWTIAWVLIFGSFSVVKDKAVYIYVYSYISLTFSLFLSLSLSVSLS